MADTKDMTPFELRSMFADRTPDAAACESCLWWSLEDADQDVGICRRFPPAFNPEAKMHRFPVVVADDWCGEWRQMAEVG